jgi:hypothetical protein
MLKKVLLSFLMSFCISSAYSQLKIESTGDGTFFNGASSSHSLILGKNRSSNGNIFVDLNGSQSDETAGYGFRFQRTGSGSSRFYHSGTGQYQFRAEDQANITFWIQGTQTGIFRHTTGNFEVRVGEAYKLGGGPFAALSDQRLKRGVKEYTDGLDEIMKLRPVSFKYTKDVDPNGKDYIGVIAQEVQDVAPYMTQKYDLRDDNDKSKGEYLSVDPNAFTYMLINAVKEQQYIIDNYKSELNAVKERVGDLIAQLEDLKSQLVVDANSNTQEQLITLTGSGAKLSQNEPNPFNGYTKINYSVPSNANSSFIKIFDSAGVTVKVVNVEGNGVLSIRAEDLPSGYYFYSLYVDDQLIDSKKMLFDK